MDIHTDAIKALEDQLSPAMLERVDGAVAKMAAAKERGGRVVAITGSGPNVHEGVTTLIAAMMRAGLIDGITTSSAVISHEMGGVLDKVRRVDGNALELPPPMLPLGGAFELTHMHESVLAEIAEDMPVDNALIGRMRHMPGNTIIKAAGNLGYPVGLWLEKVAPEIAALARTHGMSFEEMAGLGCDPRTMMGAGREKGLPVLVTIPQLIGGGAVGLAIGDSISISERAGRLARMLESADVIIESAVVLTQEIHDGPFETHTGHGLWGAWQGHPTYSLEGKTLVRIDLDPALEKVWQAQRNTASVQEAIDKGLPKTKMFKTPFRMEMSGFARLEGSIAVTGDIGVVWPLMAARLASRLGVTLDFMSYPQQTPQGQAMREWIVENIQPFSKKRMLAGLRPTKK